jgi:PTS system cellobiose-specific IIC component
VNVTQVLTFANIGSTGIFAGVLIGLLSTELFIAISLKALHISLGENVPPAVSKSFTALIPTILTLSLFAVLAAVLANVLHTDLIHLITTFIQQPLGLSIPACRGRFLSTALVTSCSRWVSISRW